MRLTSAGYCIPVAKCEPLLPSTAAPAKLRQSLPKRGIQIRGVFFSILRRMRRAHSQIAASAVRQHGNPEASRFFRKFRPKDILCLNESVFAVARVRTLRLSVFACGRDCRIIADGVSERGGYDAAAFSRNFERFFFYSALH